MYCALVGVRADMDDAITHMTHIDPQDVRDHLAAMQAVLAKSHGGWADEDSLLEFQRHCWAALHAAGDDARDQFDLIAMYARDLFSDDLHQRWTVGPLFGVDILRRKITRTLIALATQVDTRWIQAAAGQRDLRAA